MRRTCGAGVHGAFLRGGQGPLPLRGLRRKAELGYGYAVADMYKAIPNYLNTIIDGEFVTVQDEEVRVGLNYDERQVLNLYYLGDLVMIDDLLYAKELEAELFQTMPLEVSCDKQEQIVTGFNYQPSKGNKKSL